MSFYTKIIFTVILFCNGSNFRILRSFSESLFCETVAHSFPKVYYHD